MLVGAIAEFRKVLGHEYTLTDDVELKPYGWCTIPIRRQIAAVLRPGSVAEVQAITRIAALHSVALYPISTGQNWGYGSALPARDGNVVLDLGRMNKILEVNCDLAYAVVEPGVTQRSLYEHLQRQRIPLALSPTGAGPGRSILGNTLERGFSIGPYGDHFLAQCGMEVVLASGEILRTGFGHYPDAKATYVYKWGVGPYLDGLFTQSNFGIVTKMGVWLMPAPEHFEACYISCNSDDQLGPLVDGIRELLFDGVFRGPVNLLHRDRVLIMLDRYPWEEMEGRTPMSEAVAQRLAARRKIGVWNGVGAICGSRAQVGAAKRSIRRVLNGRVDRVTFLSDERLRLLRRFPRVFSVLLKLNVPELLKTLQSSYGLLRGTPTELALSLAYWRNRRPAPTSGDLNPARDHCGIMWFAPVIPMTKQDVSAFRRVVAPIFAKYGFEACFTFTALNERCFDCTLPLLYDKDDANEVRKAHECHRELMERCKERGYVPYRLGLQSMEAEMRRVDVFWDVVTKLKGALDPEGILAPGRYAR
jgi:4-cresol dehydrogenase (hydroxylating) flavoprotein subunit